MLSIPLFIKWLAEHWKSDQKFSRNGVNGSLCSFLHYLSKVRPIGDTRGLLLCISPSKRKEPLNYESQEN